MKKSEIVLIGIVAGIILVVVVGFIIASSWSQPEYRTGDAPEDIAYNYFLALQKEDLELAYRFVSPHIAFYPSFSNFKTKYPWHLYSLSEGAIQIVSVEKNGSETTVLLQINDDRDYSFFDTEYNSNPYSVNLIYVDSQWKITNIEQCWDC